MATSAAGGGGRRENTAKVAVADQTSQAVQSTSNLLHLMQQSSPSHVRSARPVAYFLKFVWSQFYFTTVEISVRACNLMLIMTLIEIELVRHVGRGWSYNNWGKYGDRSVQFALKVKS